ncbi:MAG: Txe/YoeB family addiction module toxin [Lachnospiraceae bacterium]|nr:Txe/YoeB family addiction module toxin [Lachnospiraceae bacterium]
MGWLIRNVSNSFCSCINCSGFIAIRSLLSIIFLPACACSGSGQPEPLKGTLQEKWSRRINDKDRLVYQSEDGMVILTQCRGHYDDK